MEDEEMDRMLEKGVSDTAFDVEYRQEVYNEWQEYMVEEVPVFPTVYRAALSPVNNRVLNYAIGDGTEMYKYEIAVTQEEPMEIGRASCREREKDEEETRTGKA